MKPYINILNFNLPAYGIFMVTGIFIAAFGMLLSARKKSIIIEDVIVIQAVSLLCCIVGAKLLYIAVTYTPQQIIEFIKKSDVSFLGGGGLVFYGGLIFGIAGAFASVKLLGVDYRTVESCIVPFIPLGHGIGRVGCFFAGCCYGMEYNGVFAFYPHGSEVGYFPVQLIEAVCNLMITAVLLLFLKKERGKGDALCLYLSLYATVRFCLEFFRGDEVRGIYLLFSTAQWISIAIILVCSFVQFYLKHIQKSAKKF